MVRPRFLCRSLRDASFVSIFFFTCLLAVVSANDSLVVQLTSGPIRGLVSRGSRQWLGIPFARPPVGALRWESPLPPIPWSSLRDTTAYAPGCPQQCVLPTVTCPPVVSENCLYLNVFAPLQVEGNAPLSVMVFLPGGAFEQGGAGIDFYSGAYMANHSEIIIVTVNYRLSVMGFLFTDELSGNYGIEDQRLALQWVQSNIASFGGDPRRVTLSGQSAGASSVSIHLVDPASEGLFSSVVMQSSPWGIPLKDESQSRKYGSIFTKKLGCREGDLLCMRSKTWEEVVAAQEDTSHVDIFEPLLAAFPFSPVVGSNQILKEQPLSMYLKGAFRSMPLMIGNTKEEGDMFIHMIFNKAVPGWEYDATLVALFHLNALKVKSMYPVPSNDTKDTRELLGNILTDFIFRCPGHEVAYQFRERKIPTYVYEFQRVLPWPSVWGPRYAYCEDKVCHASELPYEFHSAFSAGLSFPPEDDLLSQAVSWYWGQFVTSQVAPNPPLSSVGAPEWLPYLSTTQNASVILNVPPYLRIVHDYDADICSFWKSIGY